MDSSVLRNRLTISIELSLWLTALYHTLACFDVNFEELFWNGKLIDWRADFWVDGLNFD